jgi:hypothetical protein
VYPAVAVGHLVGERRLAWNAEPGRRAANASTLGGFLAAWRLTTGLFEKLGEPTARVSPPSVPRDRGGSSPSLRSSASGSAVTCGQLQAARDAKRSHEDPARQRSTTGDRHGAASPSPQH